MGESEREREGEMSEHGCQWHPHPHTHAPPSHNTHTQRPILMPYAIPSPCTLSRPPAASLPTSHCHRLQGSERKGGEGKRGRRPSPHSPAPHLSPLMPCSIPLHHHHSSRATTLSITLGKASSRISGFLPSSPPTHTHTPPHRQAMVLPFSAASNHHHHHPRSQHAHRGVRSPQAGLVGGEERKQASLVSPFIPSPVASPIHPSTSQTPSETGTPHVSPHSPIGWMEESRGEWANE